MNQLPKLDLDDDDRPIGRLLSRREALAILGVGTGATIVAACMPSALTTLAPTASAGSTPAPGATSTGALPSCVVKPELTEGPFFVDEKIDRSDIRSDTKSGAVEVGVPLILSFAVSKVSGNSCVPFEGAVVDVWHCNVAGEYSDIAQNGTFGRTFCAATKSRTRTATPPSPPSIQAGTAAGRCTSTSRSAPIHRRAAGSNSRPSSSSTKASRPRCSPSRLTPAEARRTRPTRVTASTAASCSSATRSGDRYAANLEIEYIA